MSKVKQTTKQSPAKTLSPPNKFPRQGREVVMSAEFRGPLPPPGMLRGYEDACPGSSNRIITMAENAQNHKMAMELRSADYLDREQHSRFLERKLGMYCAFSLAVLCIGGTIDKNTSEE